ncbi:MAG: glycosyltransferase [Syntrophotaleaceae bacterium]
MLSVGRLTEQKHYACLIEAFAKVRETQPVRLMILGEGELRPSLESQVSQLNLESDVSLPGFVINPYQYMKNAAVFALSSKWEGLPTVLIEALALGASVVSTNCRSGPEEILMNGALGRLVPVDNALALADGILGCLNSDQKPPTAESLKRYQPDWAVREYLKVVEGN